MIHEIPESIDSLFRERSTGRVYLRAPLEGSHDFDRLHYDDFDTVSKSYAREFAARGFRPGDRVGIVIGSPVHFLLAFFGGMRCGLWMAPLDPTLDYDALPQFSAQVQSLGLRAVIADRSTPTTSPIPWLGGSPRPEFHFFEHSANSSYTPSSEGGILLASSGTTGTPKVMLLSQRQFLTTATNIANHHALSSRDVGLNPLPLWHINAEVVAATASAVAGAELVLQRRFKRTDFWQLVADHGVTWINAVPAIVSHLATLREGETVSPRIRFIRSASAPLPAELITHFESVIGIPVIESYGMTEAASQICANPLDGVRKPGSVGQPVGVSLRIEPLSDDSIEAPSSGPEIGQIALHGPSVITSYASDDYSSRFTTDGWLLTGDLGYIDDDGYVFLVGRSDDVINRSGEKIYPRELEEIILQVPGVLAASVIGVPDLILGSVPLAYIEVGDDYDDSDVCQAVSGALESAIGRSKRPTAIRVVDALPRHATGKIQKNPLRDGAISFRYEALLS